MHRITLKLTIRPTTLALSSIQNNSTSWARQQSALNGCASPDSEGAPDTAPTTPTAPCRRKDRPKVPLEEFPAPREARKRPHSHIEPDDDIALPSRADKFPRVESDGSIPRSPGSVPTSSSSQQGRSTNTPKVNRPDRPTTRSRSSSEALSGGLPTLPELGESSRDLILLSQQEMRNVFSSFFEGIRKQALDRIDVLFQPDRPSQ